MATHSIREVAKTLDVSPADALDLCRKAGIGTFWHEGERFDNELYLGDYLRGHWQWDATPELTFDAAPAQMAAILVSEIQEELSEAAVEIFNQSSANNPVLNRLRKLQQLIGATA